MDILVILLFGFIGWGLFKVITLIIFKPSKPKKTTYIYHNYHTHHVTHLTTNNNLNVSNEDLIKLNNQ